MPTIPIHQLFPDIHPTGDFLVQLVDSGSEAGKQHRVDAEKFCGSMECTCKGFTASKCIEVDGQMITRRQALLNRAMPNEKLECPHIKRVRRYLSFLVLNEIIERRNNEAENNKREARKSKLVQGVPKAMEEAQSGIEVYADSQANVAGIERQGSNSEADEHPF